MKIGFTDLIRFSVRLQFCISKTAVNKIFGDEGEHLKSSFSSFHLVKTAAGGKSVASCNYVLRRRHCSEQGCLSFPYKLHLKLSHFLCQSFYAVFVLSRKVVDFLYGVVYLLNACRHFVHAVFDYRCELV